ncbi:MAG: polyprenyl synthetase family protein [Candidatus Bathyarchaeota archaeon]|nr:polyprenyl synthetase family protein [Candidatus Bathyarchaeota archaeon]
MDIKEILAENAPKIDQTIEKYIPQKFTEDAVLFKVLPPNYSHNTQALTKAISEPIWYVLGGGGKRWRPTLFLIICEALGKNPDEYIDFAIIPEVVHNGTLVIDDIEDGSEVRRGKPCLHRTEVGVDIAVNAGNAMYYLPLLSLMEQKNKFSAQELADVYEVYVQEMINLSMGQAMDIAWHKGLANADAVGEEAYMQMCAYKTGTLARMAAKLAAVLADGSSEVVEKLGRFAESIGVAFQMQDDILDLTSAQFAEGKGGFGQDITEGKRTLLVIHTLQKASTADKNRLIEILNMHTSEQALRDEAIAIINKYGAVDYVKAKASGMVEDSWRAVDGLLEASKGKEKLKAFAEFLVRRSI